MYENKALALRLSVRAIWPVNC